MGENVRFKNGHVRVETHVLRTLVFQGLLKAKVDSMSARVKNKHVKITAMKRLYTVKRGNRLRVGVHSKKAASFWLSAFARRPF